jgi:RNA polymerase sigma-70 factor (ECF subfamily)
MTELSDADALRQSLAEPRRFEVVYERHLTRVHRYIGRRVGYEHAEDLTAEVFARAFRGRARYTVQYADALPWLLGIATNVVGDHRRLERRSILALERLSNERPGEQGATEVQLGAHMLQALARLRAADRDALLLVVWGELSYQEAAQALGIPLGTVRSRTARARRVLAADMGADIDFNAISARGRQGHA